MKRNVFIKNIDFVFLIPVLLILISGLLAIYSSTSHAATSDTSSIFYKHIVWILFGLLLMVTMIFIPLKVIYSMSYLLYAVSIFSLIAVLVMGKGPSGTARWIYLFGFQFQPSEFAKLATIIAFSRFLTVSKISQNSLKDIIISLLLICVPMILIKEQPDLGTSLVFAALLLPFLFWADLPYFSLFVIIAPFISIIIVSLSMSNVFIFLMWMLILTAILYFAKKGIIVTVLTYFVNLSLCIVAPYLWSKLKPYQQNRLKHFLNQEMDPRGAGYQILQSKTALGSGGLRGKGFLHGTQSQLRFLPQQHTDFIFSVFGEEFGFLGVIFILGMYFIFILHGIHVASVTKNRFASFVAVGISSLFLIHIFVNIGMTVGLLPVTGLPLPLMSYGGSAMAVFLVMIGLLINISINRLKY